MKAALWKAALWKAALRVAAAAVIGAVAAGPAAADQRGAVASAKAFVATLSAAEAKAALYGFDAAARRRSRITPSPRAGLALKAMDPQTRSAAQAFLAAALSPEGVALVAQVRERERLLGAATGRPEYRDPDLYYLAMFGTPNLGGALWAWRLEGHHLSLNFTYEGARLRSVLPMAYGSNPEQAAGSAGALFGPLRDRVVSAAGGPDAERAAAIAEILSPAPEPFRSAEAARLAAKGALMEGLDATETLTAFGGGAEFVHDSPEENHLHVIFDSETEDFGGVK